MNPLDYLRLQLRLEGKEIVYGNMLRQVEIVPDEDLPLMVIAQLADSNVLAYFDEGFPLCEELRKKVSEISFPDVDPLFTLLQNRNSAFEVGHYKTYTFPEMYVAFMDETVNCFSRHDPKVKDFGFSGFAEQVYAMEQAGKIVSPVSPRVKTNSVAKRGCILTQNIATKDLPKKSLVLGQRN